MPPVLSPSLKRKARRLGNLINAVAIASPMTAGRMVFKLMCTPRPRAIKKVDDQFLATAQWFTLHANGHDVQMYRWPHPTLPSAPLVLLAHGWESHSGRWRDYVPAMHEAGFSVLAMDAPGHGHTPGKLLNGIIYGRTLTEIVGQLGVLEAIVGHSMGGTAAIIGLTQMRMSPPKKVIVMGSPTDIERVTIELCDLFALKDRARRGIYDYIAKWAPMSLPEYKLHHWVGNQGHVSAFVVHDTDDDVAPVTEGRQLAEVWPNATYLETSGLGHRFLPPEKAIPHVVSFIKSV